MQWLSLSSQSLSEEKYPICSAFILREHLDMPPFLLETEGSGAATQAMVHRKPHTTPKFGTKTPLQATSDTSLRLIITRQKMAFTSSPHDVNNFFISL
jgi:hypothetical protein